MQTKLKTGKQVLDRVEHVFAGGGNPSPHTYFPHTYNISHIQDGNRNDVEKISTILT